MTLFSRQSQSSVGRTHSLAPDLEYSQVECPHNQILNETYNILSRKHHPFKEKSAFFGWILEYCVVFGKLEGEQSPSHFSDMKVVFSLKKTKY